MCDGKILYEDGECRYDLGSYTTGSWNMKDFCGYVTDDLRMFTSYYVYFDACQNYIGTICNLEEPITKTDSQSLKILKERRDARRKACFSEGSRADREAGERTSEAK